MLHPHRRADAAARQEIEQPTRRLDDADIGEVGREFLDEGLFIGNAERYPEIVRRQRVDLGDLGPQRLAAQKAVATADDLEIGILLANAGDRGGVLRLVRAQQVEGETGGLRLAGNDVKQVGGRDALGQRRL